MGVGVDVLAVIRHAQVEAVGDHPAQHVVSQLPATALTDGALGQLARHPRPPAPIRALLRIYFTHFASALSMTKRSSASRR